MSPRANDSDKAIYSQTFIETDDVRSLVFAANEGSRDDSIMGGRIFFRTNAQSTSSIVHL